MSDNDDRRWNDDGDERTVFVPTPGRGAREPAPYSLPDPDPLPPSPRSATENTRRETPRAGVDPRAPGPIIPGTGVNPLVTVASPLLTLISTLQKTERLSDPMGLRERIERQMRAFGADTSRSRATPETLKTASYCLCTAIDETVLRTPWGAASDWRKLSLLRALHGDAWGGEKFFEVLQARMRDPGPNIDLLELLYICLALGFEGKYAMLDDGKSKRERVTDNLYELIRRQRGEIEHDLSPHWSSEEEAKVKLEHSLPIWVAGAIAAALLLTIFIGFRFFLADTSAQPLDALAKVGRDKPTPVIEPVREQPMQVVVTDKTSGQTRVIDRIIEPPPPIVPRAPEPDVDLRAELAGFLQPEIDAGLVDVLETGTQVTVRISAPSGSSLFASGSDKVAPAFVDVIERIRVGIAEQQARIPGDIIVVGHTDSVPIRRSLRFQDNRDLSQARATSVAKMLAADKAPPITSTIEKMGKGADDPVDGNDPVTGNQTAEQRARNRRVEILIEK